MLRCGLRTCIDNLRERAARILHVLWPRDMLKRALGVLRNNFVTGLNIFLCIIKLYFNLISNCY